MFMQGRTNSFTGGDFEDLGGKTNGPLDTELLVLCTVNQVSRDWRVRQERFRQKEMLLTLL